jgi:anti-sigma B factor antagonist
MDLTLNVYSDSPDYTVVAVGGEIDVYSAPKLGGLKRVRAHDGWIDLVCTQGRILRIFRITGLSRVFSIYESVAEAVAAHTEPPPAADGDGDAAE